MIRFIALALALLLLPTQAEAQSCPCGSYRVKVARDWPFDQYERRCYRCTDSTRVYAYERRHDEDRWERRDQCLSVEVDVLSTEHQSEDKAREAARKLWMSKTQWQHGGQYMSLDEAAKVRWRCGPSNAHDTIAGRLSEGVAQLTGREGQNVRCQLWAHPCRTERTPGDEKGRR